MPDPDTPPAMPPPSADERPAPKLEAPVSEWRRRALAAEAEVARLRAELDFFHEKARADNAEIARLRRELEDYRDAMLKSFEAGR